MSSQRRIVSSRANGAKSHGPITPEGKKRSSQNALDHGLFAKCVLLDGEGIEEFEVLMQAHLDRFQPDKVELCVIEQMCAAQWRLGRVMTMETQALNKQLALQPAGANPYPLADAFAAAAASPAMALLQRYESRLQLIYQRAIRSLKLLRTIEAGPNETAKNEPNPSAEHSEPVQSDPPSPPQPADSEPVVEARISRPKSSPQKPAPAPNVPAQPPVAPPAPPASPKEPGGDV